MVDRRGDVERGLDALRRAIAAVLTPQVGLQLAAAGPLGGPAQAERFAVLISEAVDYRRPDSRRPSGPPQPRSASSDSHLAASSEDEAADRERLIALVELARTGDGEAFGQLFDHYHRSVFRFLYYRVGQVQLAEDLTSDTFVRALRSIEKFTWQGRDFGAWLITIARNLSTDHFKSASNRLEQTTEDMSAHDDVAESPEVAVFATITNEALHAALAELPSDQQECVIMRFLQGMSIADTAAALGRSEGAIKQLQLRGVRNLAKLMPEGLR